VFQANRQSPAKRKRFADDAVWISLALSNLLGWGSVGTFAASPCRIGWAWLVRFPASGLP